MMSTTAISASLEQRISNEKPPSTSPYESLKPAGDDEIDCIRLLQLFPGTFDDPIRIKLQTHSISGLPEYEALSYAWGSQKSSTPAYIDGHPLEITENLDVALRHIRYEQEPRTMWIDAVCINQHSIEERNHQVLLMAAIYSRASLVLVWLGPAADDSDYVMNRIINKDENQVVPDSEGFRFTLAVSHILKRPWFSRIWVIQEIVLATTEPVVVCGTLTSPLSDFLGNLMTQSESCKIETSENSEKGQSSYRVKGDDDPSAWELAKAERGITDINMSSELHSVLAVAVRTDAHWRLADNEMKLSMMNFFQVYRKCRQTKGFYLDFASVYSMTLGRYATDPRDHVYGMLGMINPTTDSNSNILPDYSKSVGLVFAEASACLIKQNIWYVYFGGSLCSKGRNEIADLPSWVPDLACFPQNTVLKPGCTMSLRDKHDRQSLAVVKDIVSATVYFSVDYRILYAKGASFGRISSHFGVRKPYLFNVPVSESCTESYVAMMQEYRLANPALEVNKEYISFYSYVMVQLGYFASKNGVCAKKVLSFVLSDRGRENVESHVPEWPKDAELKKWACDWVATAGSSDDFIPEHTVFVTDTGLLGVIIGNVENGDVVAGLFGINLPFVLCEVAERYNMINVAEVVGHKWGTDLIPAYEQDQKKAHQTYASERFTIY